ncbi:ABC transporter permease [Hoeflea prorocentri]|uniref:ABC transporter permease subunit n=1 Tax=Hoeflea prorocentri TaxID=1922333 RepID=A0A9X3UJU1_9HYPH|nr:ABC transporter permease subunit [Hoeflea prorocentri]MCY6382163.1 ABC transporter permease subunit [Hoeflea prorocentri]MDA5399963.1 ABC transporter permease subunit [Hoeflea prorocentri]
MAISETAELPEVTDQNPVKEFVAVNETYYEQQFKIIGDKRGFAFTWNWAAFLLGSIWFGMRSIWSYFLPFVALETLAIVQLARGIWGDLGAPILARLPGIENTLAFRREQLAEARENAPDKVETFENAIASLERAIEGIKQEAAAANDTALQLIIMGLAGLLLIKSAEALLANGALQARFTQWLSDRTIGSGLKAQNIALAFILAAMTYITCSLKFGFPDQVPSLTAFPADPQFQASVADAIKQWMANAAVQSEWFFDGLTFVIRGVLDALETIFVETPWPVMGGFILLLTGLSAGWRAAVFTGAGLAYLGYLGFWDKSMKTLALLGTAACISISLGIPLGIACARSSRLYAFVRPVLDFMQTMPAFVYLIPVIAFFGTGKPAAIIATMIFGGSPVVRLTVLGLKGVPNDVREAAMAFGGNKRYLLWKVDLPLAMPSIMAGINQTILLSLAMVVIASLIGAKGLGEDVLEALQYASEGQGILAGLAILFCAMILDRIIQGKRR